MITLLCDLNIEGRAFAKGERVTLSPESEKLNIRKGFAIKTEDDPITDDIHSTGGQLPDTNRGKKLPKGKSKRGR